MTDTTTPLTEADKILAECAGEPEAEERLATLCDRLERELAAATLSLSEGKGKLWLWRNFVDGRPEYWAFDNPHPIHLDNGDPQTLGEPCGYAVVKPSRNGRPDVPESKVLAAIDRALKKEQAPYAEKTSAALVSVVRAYDHHQDNIAAGLGVVSGGKLRDAIDAARPLLLRAEYEIGTLNADPLPPEAHVTRWKGIDLDPPATSYAEAERRYMEAAGDGAHGLEKPQMGHAVGKRERIDATEEYCDWLAEYQSINAADAEIMAGRYDHFDMAECFAAGVSVGQRWHSQDSLKDADAARYAYCIDEMQFPECCENVDGYGSHWRMKVGEKTYYADSATAVIDAARFGTPTPRAEATARGCHAQDSKNG